jgi:CelD/BcsL family acetyltransferase involved in cellulose biosynthesis
MQGSTSDDRISVRAFSDLEVFATVGDVWNSIVRESGASPFLLAEFIVQFMRLQMLEGWHPLLLLLSVDGVPVGVAPLMTRKHFGVRTTGFLLFPYLSPDFALEDRYRGQCIEKIVQFAFQKLQSDLLELTLPAESPNGRLLKVQCELRNLHYKVQNLPANVQGHRLVPIYPSWDEPFIDSIGKPIFLSSQGHEFTKNINRMKRNLNRAGTWRIHYVDDLSKEPHEVERIHAVEKLSWKEELRRQRGEADESLHATVKGSIHASASEPNFKCSVCFLELNGQTIAYALSIRYGKLAYIAKTSFAEEYRNLSPGVFTVNESIRALCDQGQVIGIDFLTDLPFHKTWTTTLAMRVGVVVSRSRLYNVLTWLYRVFSRMQSEARKRLRIPSFP